MTDSKSALYRLDFRTNLTSAAAPTINFGYMLETALDGGFRFLGLASRKSLSKLERDLINFRTWPELDNLDSYMGKLFERAWEHVCQAEPEDLRLGAEFVAREHTLQSAFCFVHQPVAALGLNLSGEVDQVHNSLYSSLVSLGHRLTPALTAPVLPMMPLAVGPERAPSPKYRSEAEQSFKLAA